VPEGWIEAGIAVLEKIRETQGDAIERASEVCAEAIGAGGFVHLFGTGHSRIPVEEMFPRYGSYPGFHPIVELSSACPVWPKSSWATSTSRRRTR